MYSQVREDVIHLCKVHEFQHQLLYLVVHVYVYALVTIFGTWATTQTLPILLARVSSFFFLGGGGGGGGGHENPLENVLPSPVIFSEINSALSFVPKLFPLPVFDRLQ